MLKRIFLISGFFVLGTLLFSFTTFLLLPVDTLEIWLKDLVRSRSGVVLSGGTFQKVFPFGLEARGLNVHGQGSSNPFALRLDRVRAVLIPRGLLSGRLVYGLDGEMAGGDMGGEVSFGIRSVTLNLDARDIRLDSLPLPVLVKIDGSGFFDGRIDIDFTQQGCASGSIKVEGERIDVKKVRFLGFKLPFGRIGGAGMVLGLKDCEAEVEGLWLEGEEVALRLNGVVSIRSPLARSPLSLLLEVVTKKENDKGFLPTLLAPYRRSANYYLIPIEGTLGRPAPTP